MTFFSSLPPMTSPFLPIIIRKCLKAMFPLVITQIHFILHLVLNIIIKERTYKLFFAFFTLLELDFSVEVCFV